MNGVSKNNKPNSHNQTRKQTVRIGENEALILEFSKYHYLIQAAQVRVWAKENYGIELNLKRIHDSLQRLVRKGIVEKISRGVYRLTEFGKQILFLVDSKTRKETESRVSNNVENGDGNVVKRVVRVHVYSNSFEDFVRKLVYVKKIVDCALRYVISVLGSSRFRRIARSVSVSCTDFMIGAHGFYSLRHRPLVSLDRLSGLGLKPKEFGVDVFTNVVVDKLFAKVYVV